LGFSYRSIPGVFTTTAAAITPGIGWKIDVGKSGGFYLQPGLATSFLLFGESVFFDPRIYMGMGYAF
jgi:hypothetical protein